MLKKLKFIKHKKLSIKFITYIILILKSHLSYSQIFNADQNPPSVKWLQIHTENFQIIYPFEFNNEAQRMANVLEKTIEKVSESLNKKPKKISIILQNQGTTSNGFVQLAPRRSEFFTTPSQSFDYQNWLNSLAIHELRHVVQFDKLTGSYNSPPFEALSLAIFGINLPPWFYEGDAVLTETSLTKAGRGRIPEWNIILRSNLLSDKNFSYSKDYFGSLKDFTPGYYQLGFFMNTKQRREFGDNITDQLFNRIRNLPFRPYNLSNSLKKFTGLSTRMLHHSTVTELKNLWSDQLSQVNYENYRALHFRKNTFAENYLLPTAISNERILFLKNSKAENPAFYILEKNGKQKRILTIGYQEIPWFSYANEKIVWDELRHDPRYYQRSFNVINIYNLKTKRARQITHKSRLFAPALSPNGEIITAIEIGLDNQIYLVELDSDTGKILNRYASPQNDMLQMPSFNAAGDKIILVGIARTGKTLYEFDRRAKTFNQLFPLQLQEILRPAYAGEQIVFKAHFNGIDNLYRFDPADKQIYQISSAKFGAYNPSYDSTENKILFNNYSANGYDIASLTWNQKGGQNISNIENTFVDYAKPISSREGGIDVFDSIPNLKYQSSRYKEFNNLFYFHSFYPITDENTSGIQLQSDNKLNTLSFYTGYQFNSALRKSEYTAGFAYKRFYPIFDVNYTNRARLSAKLYQQSTAFNTSNLEGK